MTQVMNLRAEDRTSKAGGTIQWSKKVVLHHYHRYCPGEAWAPAANLYEDHSHYFVIVDLAGVRSEAIEVTVEEPGGLLTIAGERPVPDVAEDCGDLKLHLMEIDHGAFRRTVNLPKHVDHEAISAVYRGGFLWIRIPKR